MEPTIVSRKTITVLGVQARLTNIDEGVPEMWEQRFTSDHDCIVVLRTDKFYRGCAFSPDRLGTCDYLAGMAVPALAAGSDGLTLREVLGGFCAKVERTAGTQDSVLDLIAEEWMPASEYERDESRPVLDCYPPATMSSDS